MTTPVENKDKFVRRVQALLDRAAHPETPEAERATALEHASKIMNDRRIDQAMLRQQQSKSEKKRDIVTREHRLEDHFEFMGDQARMMFSVFRHCGANVISRWDGIEVVGYEDDVENGEMLWLTIQMDFITKLFPEWNRLLPTQSNVFNLKSSGKSWMDIVHLAPLDAGINANSGTTLRSMYKREAEKRGIDPETVQHSRTPKKYRINFADSYASRIQQRLAELDKVYHDETDRDESKSLALVDSKAAVDEVFFAKYPHLHPDRIAEKNAEYRREYEKLQQEEKERWDSLTTKQQERETKQQDREYQRYARRMNRQPSSYDALGWANGKQAADSVNLAPKDQFKMKEQIGE